MDALRLIYITCTDLSQARLIGRALVEERLAACVNLLPGMQSCYRWEGALEEAVEVVLIAKTVAGSTEALIARVKQLHTARVPCVLVLPVLGGNEDYLAWIRSETGRAP